MPLSWERQMRTVLATSSGEVARAALIGTAGSGKSTALRHLRSFFRAQSRTVHLVHGELASSASFAAEDVLLVDDLHLLPAADLALVRERADDAAASLIVAGRPWPATPAVHAVTRSLEQHVPTIVLGHVTRADVLDRLAATGTVMSNGCVDDILTATQGISWLVAAALQHHDDRDCRHDGSHAGLDRVMAALIAHRLDTAEEAVRRAVEAVCVLPPHDGDPEPDTGDDWAMRGYAHGLLLRSGDAPPVVRAAVWETTPTQRFIDLWTRRPEIAAAMHAGRSIRGARAAAALTAAGDRLLVTAPARAMVLFDAAIDSGAAVASLARRRAVAAWSTGDIETASEVVEQAMADSGTIEADLASIAAALWAARGMMPRAWQVLRGTDAHDLVSSANAVVASIASGSAAGAPVLAASPPSMLGVSMELLQTGLTATLAARADGAALVDLVRSAEMYTRSRVTAPQCEVPAVIAAVVALNLGRVPTARMILDDAIAHDHGGRWARPRLLLWNAWAAVQSAQPIVARDLLSRAFAAAPAGLCPRDELLGHAVRVAIARRYEDASGLEAAWRDARGFLLRADVDLFLLLPLSEFVGAAARLGGDDRVDDLLSDAMEIVERLGAPPLWAAHVRWAGIQQGILLSSPERLAPHAKALVAAAAHSRIAAHMARAGRVWTDVLAGTVHADAVTSAAEGLAEIGLMWDAARLAGHGAARSADRRVAAQLLACAREMHPNDGTRRLSATTADGTAESGRPHPEEVLSEREIEVARLVLQGKTYAEIGESIFISPRTAEHHIAHIRRRLGATSRSEVLVRLRLLLGDGGTGAEPEGGPP